MTDRCSTENCNGADVDRLVVSMRPTQGKDRRPLEHDFGIRCRRCQDRLLASLGAHNSKVRELVTAGVHPRIAARRALQKP